MKKYIITIICVILLLSIIILTILLTKNKENDKQVNNIDTIKQISQYNNPIIPEGFKKVETDFASWNLENGIPIGWNKGLVIEDSIGNQFVWIPVNLKELHYSKNAKSYYEEYMYNVDNLKDDKYINQILKYGGFYISRYEAGIDESRKNNITNISSQSNDFIGIPVSKKGSLPWNFISYKNAKASAEKMYETEKIKSGLPSMEQELLIFDWLQESGYNVYEDSSSWGNYSNVNFEFTGYYSIDYGKNYDYKEKYKKQTYNMILSTGVSERNKANNIYDFAGNLWEYTSTFMEKRGYYCVGGHYDHTGIHFSAGSSNLTNIHPLEKVGYRVVLFLNI